MNTVALNSMILVLTFGGSFVLCLIFATAVGRFISYKAYEKSRKKLAEEFDRTKGK